MYLAQLNVARLRYPADDPRLSVFMNGLELVNGIAERSPGFVWRLKDAIGSATSINVTDDPTLIVNLSVWASAESLEQFVWQTVHKRFYGRRGEWFEAPTKAHLVLWWIPEGHIPGLDEAMERLESLRRDSPSEHAFGWENLPSVQLWREARCG